MWNSGKGRCQRLSDRGRLQHPQPAFHCRVLRGGAYDPDHLVDTLLAQRVVKLFGQTSGLGSEVRFTPTIGGHWSLSCRKALLLFKHQTHGPSTARVLHDRGCRLYGCAVVPPHLSPHSGMRRKEH